jgi:hypothetical protein
MNPARDMTGLVVGELTVLRRARAKTRDGHVKWSCRCSCGRRVIVGGHLLRRALAGKVSGTTSCGHVRREVLTRGRSVGQHSERRLAAVRKPFAERTLVRSKAVTKRSRSESVKLAIRKRRAAGGSWGRPRVHADDAAKQRAYRDRKVAHSITTAKSN